jgi:hypothetical protein
LRIEQRSEKKECESDTGNGTHQIGLSHWRARSDADIL